MVQHCSIEFLPNIRQLVILVPINVDNIENTSKLLLNRTEKRLHTDANTSNDDILISVPGRILLESLIIPVESIDNFPQVHRIDNVLILQFKNVNPKGTFAHLTKLQSAKLLQGQCKEILCSNCSYSLKSLSGSETFKDLPNEHWLELLDCWSCHDNEFAPIAERALNQKIPSHQCCAEKKCSSSPKSYQEMNNSDSGLILPPSGKIYLGISSVLWNRVDFDFEKCPSCHAIVSEPQQDSHVKVFRDTIKFKLSDDSKTCVEESLTTILMHRILDIIDNHSTFHFVLKASEIDRLYLRPISWNLQVFDFDSQSWRLAFKLGFVSLTEASHNEAETIICTPNQYKQIKEILQNSHENDLFNSSFKVPGSYSCMKLSYLIN